MKHYLFEGLDRYMRDLKDENNKKVKKTFNSYRNKLDEGLDLEFTEINLEDLDEMDYSFADEGKFIFDFNDGTQVDIYLDMEDPEAYGPNAIIEEIKKSVAKKGKITFTDDDDNLAYSISDPVFIDKIIRDIQENFEDWEDWDEDEYDESLNEDTVNNTRKTINDVYLTWEGDEDWLDLTIYPTKKRDDNEDFEIAFEEDWNESEGGSFICINEYGLLLDHVQGEKNYPEITFENGEEAVIDGIRKNNLYNWFGYTKDEFERAIKGKDLIDVLTAKKMKVNQPTFPKNLKSYVEHFVDYWNEVIDDPSDFDEFLNEDTIKRRGKWVNVGKDGKANSGKFKTKKEADAQRRAMFANGYKGESLEEETNMDKINKYLKSIKEKPITEDKEEEEPTNMERIAGILKGKPLPPSRKRIEEPQEPTPVKGPIRDKDGKTNMDKIHSLLGESKSKNTKSMNLYESINRGFERLYGDLDSTKPVVSRKQLTEAKSKKYPIKDFLISHLKDVSAILDNRNMSERDMKKAIIDLLRSSDIPSTQIDKFEYELNNSRNWKSTIATYLTSLRVDSSSKSKNESKETYRKLLKEYKDLGQDLGEYQKYVDADMDKDGHISKKTMDEIKKAGLSVVKDQYGQYEVIAKEKDHLAKSKNESKKPAPKKKSREEIVEAYRRNLRKRKLAEAMARKREERKNK